MNNPLILIGAGGHAKCVADALTTQGKIITHFVDDIIPAWLSATPMSEADLHQQCASIPDCIIGFVGLSVDALSRRLALLRTYQQEGAIFTPVIHKSAIISPSARIGAGVHVLAGAIVNAGAIIEEGAVINTGAVIEHDAHIGAGCHIAPRAVVLGKATLGECCFIGSNAVVIQGASMGSQFFVKALSVHK